MDNARQQIVDSIRNHNNILVTVSDSPSVDELSAALGLTILLNNMDKRATAVVSGAIPPAINFLEPNKTFENTTDSLRDFIIALDKEKADHLRYKVDGDLVKIFITPYRTTLSQTDLEFSQGDYNVELVIGIGVKDQDHLDKSLAAHGKILHDATVVTMTAGADASTLGSTDWHDAAASSLSEMMVSLVDGLKADKPLLDEQISSAFLTGIVSATDRFSNGKTTSRVMTMAAQLMAAGANQQLIAAKLEEAHDIGPASAHAADQKSEVTDVQKDASNELTIDRSDKQADEPAQPEVGPDLEPPRQESQETQDQIELEKELAGITSAPAGTMADIEKELQEATGVTDTPEPMADEGIEPLTASSDDMMPGFEATGASIAPQASDSDTSQPDESPFAPAPPIPIINEHGTFSDEPPQASPLNSIQAESGESEAVVDPLYAPVAMPEPEISPQSFVPEQPMADVENTPVESVEVPESSVPAYGTAEGAAFLSGESAPSMPDVPLAPPSIPPLPPLPPLPTDGSLPPLPPPPPPLEFNQPTAPLPPGAVPADQLGDIFGDAANAQAQSAPAPAPEPGQYRIPGQ